ncbi:MAG: hypothetical protein HEP71_30050 [Roseivirga sp.]|nr:hypothetical protein [Roseivirga sp.]
MIKRLKNIHRSYKAGYIDKTLLISELEINRLDLLKSINGFKACKPEIRAAGLIAPFNECEHLLFTCQQKISNEQFEEAIQAIYKSKRPIRQLREALDTLAEHTLAQKKLKNISDLVRSTSICELPSYKRYILQQELVSTAISNLQFSKARVLLRHTVPDRVQGPGKISKPPEEYLELRFRKLIQISQQAEPWSFHIKQPGIQLDFRMTRGIENLMEGYPDLCLNLLNDLELLLEERKVFLSALKGLSQSQMPNVETQIFNSLMTGGWPSAIDLLISLQLEKLKLRLSKNQTQLT